MAQSPRLRPSNACAPTVRLSRRFAKCAGPTLLRSCVAAFQPLGSIPRLPSMDHKRRKREIEQLEKKVEDLRRLASPQIPEAELERVRAEINFLKRDFHDHLDAWQRTQLARHPQRPSTLDYIRLLFADFTEIHGDRAFADDPAMVTGMARFHRSEEHTSELQSRLHLVCRLLLEKKKNKSQK